MTKADVNEAIAKLWAETERLECENCTTGRWNCSKIAQNQQAD
jgi:hypothetical protein